MVEKLTEKWKKLVNKFKQDVERTEESTKEKSEIVKAGIIKWQEFFNNNLWVCKNLAFMIFITLRLVTQPTPSLITNTEFGRGKNTHCWSRALFGKDLCSRSV
jgi:hypothetical protein